MTQNKEKKILLAVDDSEYALHTARYISHLESLKKRELLFLNVFANIPATYWDLQKQPGFGHRITEIRAWEAQRAASVRDRLEKARQILLKAGFPDTAVRVDCRERMKGVARDIVAEAGHGYEAVVIGRRGISKVRGAVLGSIAVKLLERLTAIPLLMIGRKVRPGKILVAFDGSAGAMKAVDRVADLFADSGWTLNLTHVVRDTEKDDIGAAEKRIVEAFDAATDRLTRTGIPRRSIHTQIITGVKSRSEAIVGEARQGGYGTVVVGRRGHSEVRDFFMGSVSYKVVQMARGHAVLVVS